MTIHRTGRPAAIGPAGTPTLSGANVIDNPQTLASLSPAFADALQNSRHALLTEDPGESLARVLTTFHNEHRAEVLRDAEEICDEAGASYTGRGLNEHADAAYTLMERFRRKAEEAEQTGDAVPVRAAAHATEGQLASLAVNAANALSDEKRHYRIACEENARLRATIDRVRRLHDNLDTETDLASPADEITRGAAAWKIAAALDGWTDPAELRRMADEAQQQPDTETPTAYGDGKGRVFCVACPRPADPVPLTVEDVDHWELCPGCGRHVVDVARAVQPSGGSE